MPRQWRTGPAESSLQRRWRRCDPPHRMACYPVLRPRGPGPDRRRAPPRHGAGGPNADYPMTALAPDINPEGLHQDAQIAPMTRKSSPNRRLRSSWSACTTPGSSSSTNRAGDDIIGLSGSGAGAAGGLDVLVDVERVVRVVAPLDLGEAVVVAAVGRLHPVLTL